MTQFFKDPDARLDYTFDWGPWLHDGETIDSYQLVDLVGGIEVDQDSSDDTTVTVWLTGGDVSTRAGVTCRITTTEGRVDDRTLSLWVTQR